MAAHSSTLDRTSPRPPPSTVETVRKYAQGPCAVYANGTVVGLGGFPQQVAQTNTEIANAANIMLMNLYTDAKPSWEIHNVPGVGQYARRMRIHTADRATPQFIYDGIAVVIRASPGDADEASPGDADEASPGDADEASAAAAESIVLKDQADEASAAAAESIVLKDQAELGIVHIEGARDELAPPLTKVSPLRQLSRPRPVPLNGRALFECAVNTASPSGTARARRSPKDATRPHTSAQPIRGGFQPAARRAPYAPPRGGRAPRSRSQR
jgi:hypothetical protein